MYQDINKVALMSYPGSMACELLTLSREGITIGHP